MENIRIGNTLEMNGDESWMMDNYANNDYSFYPIGRCLDAERAENKQKEDNELL
jgi:hypothetical protein